MSERNVTRVLVMLEYEPGDPDNGEVYDLTALLPGLVAQSSYRAEISLHVNGQRSFSDAEGPPKRTVAWGCYLSNGPVCSGRSGHLADIINTSLPDGERVVKLRNGAKRLRKKADQLDFDAGVAKLEQVAAVRHLHPIARVTQNPQILTPSEKPVV